MQMAIYGEPFVLLPALDGANVAPQVRSNLFPGIKTINQIAGGHGLCCAVPFASSMMRCPILTADTLATERKSKHRYNTKKARSRRPFVAILGKESIRNAGQP